MKKSLKSPNLDWYAIGTCLKEKNIFPTITINNGTVLCLFDQVKVNKT